MEGHLLTLFVISECVSIDRNDLPDRFNHCITAPLFLIICNKYQYVINIILACETTTTLYVITGSSVHNSTHKKTGCQSHIFIQA